MVSAVLFNRKGGFFFAFYLFFNKEARPINTRQNVKISVHVIIGVTSFSTEVTNRQTTTPKSIIMREQTFVNQYL